MTKMIISLGIIAVVLMGAFLIFYVAVFKLHLPAQQKMVAGTGATFTLSEVASHNTEASCYVAIRGKVFDLTNWIEAHPGGKEQIIGLCGTEATVAFEAQHQGQREPEGELSEFYIGNLKS